MWFAVGTPTGPTAAPRQLRPKARGAFSLSVHAVSRSVGWNKRNRKKDKQKNVTASSNRHTRRRSGHSRSSTHGRDRRECRHRARSTATQRRCSPHQARTVLRHGQRALGQRSLHSTAGVGGEQQTERSVHSPAAHRSTHVRRGILWVSTAHTHVHRSCGRGGRGLKEGRPRQRQKRGRGKSNRNGVGEGLRVWWQPRGAAPLVCGCVGVPPSMRVRVSRQPQQQLRVLSTRHGQRLYVCGLHSSPTLTRRPVCTALSCVRVAARPLSCHVCSGTGRHLRSPRSARTSSACPQSSSHQPSGTHRPSSRRSSSCPGGRSSP